ncbi:hypothetical protein DMH04_26725 [Kibdelosporangium aridum]|uniref:GerMN domain-containing protein n=1 Tax=Kibdelosporangium aridum TaxID=2030 RepID=A0A428Z577_KIBAR|nr:hypothetical protein [Kibdelosporangium aridum]RSM81943.1 hypothetical protein DMH04_26725 [Kibdelosporangium aridum]
MNRFWLAAAALLLTGCGVHPSGVIDAGDAPTGVAPGVTLYFVNAHNELEPDLRSTERLGSISEAMSLLLTGPGNSDLHTEIASNAPRQVVVTTTPEVIRLTVPLAIREVTPRGIDQIVCTALGVHVQSGGSRNTKVQVRFTLTTPESDKLRTCPVW